MDQNRRHLPPLTVVAGVRTPFAKAFGALRDCQAETLGERVLTAALQAASLKPEDLDEVVFGNVATPPHAANIARVIAVKAGVPLDRPAHTVSRNCASGMESIVSAWHAIDEGRARVVLAGGVESMSNIPFQLSHEFQNWMIDWQKKKGASWFGHLAKLRPGMLKPIPALKVGLTDPTCGLNMGETAEVLAKEFNISRQAQDEFALASHQRTATAWERCFLKDEVIPLQECTLEKDNGFRAQQSMQALAKLKPAFDRDQGTVTPGNSSQLTDGGSALIVCNEQSAQQMEAEPLGVIRAYAIAGCDPKRMGLGPVFAIDRLLKQTGKSLSDFEQFEINEAFAAQVLACLEALASPEFCRRHLDRGEPIGEIPREKLNVNGGAIALGHPLGASGNRLILTLLRSLKEQGLQHGLAALCVGGGQGMALWVERI